MGRYVSIWVYRDVRLSAFRDSAKYFRLTVRWLYNVLWGG